MAEEKKENMSEDRAYTPEDLKNALKEYKASEEPEASKVIEIISALSTGEIREALGGTKCHCIVNQKGGVSKTISTSNIAYVLAKRGFKCLIIDTDSQSSLTGLCNVLPNDYSAEETKYISGLQDIYNSYVDNRGTIDFERDIKPCILRPTYKKLVRVETGKRKYDIREEKEEFGFDLIPSDIELSGFDIKLARLKNGGFSLYRIVETIKANADYDFILIDCPPALTMLAYNGIGASVDGCIIPINLEVMTLRGTKNVIDAIIEIQEFFKGAQRVHKGVLGMIKSEYVKRSRVQRDFEDIVKDFFPVRAFDTPIPSLTACDKAHAKGMLFAQDEPKAYDAFNKLVNEIIATDIIRNDETETVITDNINEEVADKLYQQ